MANRGAEPGGAECRRRYGPGYFRCSRYHCIMSLPACGEAAYWARHAAEELVQGTPPGAIPRWQLDRLSVCGGCIQARYQISSGLRARAFKVLQAEYDRTRKELESVDWLMGDEPWERRREYDRWYREAHRERRAAYNRQWRRRRREGGKE